MSHLLIVDDDPNTLASLSRAFRLTGTKRRSRTAPRAPSSWSSRSRFDMIFSDVVMPGKDGIALLEEIRGLGVTTPVVMISGQATLDMAVRATRLGAVDFLEKPLSTEKLLLTLENAVRLKRLEQENDELRRRVGRHEIVWASDAMRRVMARWSASPPASRASASSARPAPARNWSRARFTIAAPAATGRSSP